ncbi:MAG: Y-family DNA polymerase [Bacteroidales bacterium]|nr:Y-family DNA polymerase [Bacteroidales bacterium]
MAFVGLCDCNNFFVSCERVFRPDLERKPVMVLSNNDGCVVARSNEVKALGIKMGVPLYQVRDLVKRHNIAVFSSNYQLYGDMSARVMNILRQSAPDIEVYSIDEAFLNLDEMPLDTLQPFARNLSARIRREVGIPVSIGISPTKTLAKIASKLCKKYPKLQGGCLMYRPQDVEKVLSTFPAGDVWGIGRRSNAKLLSMGIETALGYYNLPQAVVDRVFNLPGLRTWKELHGEPCIGFEDVPQDRQTVCISRSFAKEMTTLEELDAAVSTFTAKVAEKLRSGHLCAQQMSVFILTNRFREDAPQSYKIMNTLFDVATDDTLEMSERAALCLRQIFRPGYAYKKAGVMCTRLVPKRGVQASMLDTVDRSKRASLMDAIDAINKVEGNYTVRLASQGVMDQFSARTMTSRKFTTSWDEIMEVKV